MSEYRTGLLPLLRQSAEDFTTAVGGASQQQFHFKPAPGKWSIAETAEHVTLAETGSGKLLRSRLVKEPAPPEVLAEIEGKERLIDARLRVRDRVFPAPDFVLPTGRWPTPVEVLGVFRESRDATIAFLETTALDLSRYAAPHPALGMLNGYQWAYFMAVHALRHVGQIREIRSAAGYPGAGPS